jgi:hypothetical protein
MRILPAAALILAATTAQAQDPAMDATCSNVRVAMPAEFAGWSEQTPVAAGTEAGGGATIRLGQAVRVALHPAQHLKLDPAPKRAGPHGGTLTLVIAQAGTYRLALGAPVWIDLIQNNKALASSAHAHGPKCSGIRKTVTFNLSPGNYVVQLSGSDADSVSLLAAKVS